MAATKRERVLTEHIMLRLSKEDHEAITEAATEQDVYPSVLVRKIVKGWLRDGPHQSTG